MALPAHAEVELLVEARPGQSSSALGLKDGGGVRLRRFDPGELADPIASGRLAARLEASDGVVAVGFAAADWAARELENVHVHFAGGVSRVSGATLKARGWTGELPYAAPPFLDLARAERWKRVGVFYTPGFEGVLPALREAAAARGLKVEAQAVGLRPAILPAARALGADCDALWILGDPVLTEGAGFAYLVELSLSRRLPLLAPEARLVDAGAYAAWEPDWEAVAAHAARLATAARGTAGWPVARVAFGGSKGEMHLNEVLKRRWAGGRGAKP